MSFEAPSSPQEAQRTQNKMGDDVRIKALCDQVRETAFALHNYLCQGHLEMVYENGLARTSHALSSRDAANGLVARRAKVRTPGCVRAHRPKDEASGTLPAGRAASRSRMSVRNAA